MTPEEQLKAEHAIYKKFYDSINDKPRGRELNEHIYVLDYIKAKLYDVQIHLKNKSEWLGIEPGLSEM